MKLRKYIISLLAALLAASALIACDTETTENHETVSETPPATETTTAPPQIEYFTWTSDAFVIRPSGDISDTMLTAIKLFTSAGKELVEGGVNVSEDWYRDELVRHDVEILLGNTNRPESAAAFEELTFYDYMYEVVSPNVVVICGGSDSATLKAVQKFFFDCYGYRAGLTAKIQDIPVGTSYVYRHDYEMELSLCGKPIEGYTIVHQDGKLHQAAAKLIQQQLSRITGVRLPLATTAEFREGDAILLGMSDMDGGHWHRDYGSYSFAMGYEKVGEYVHVIADSTANINLVAQAVADTLLAGVPSKGSYDIVLREEPRIYCACSDTMYGLSLVGVSDESVITEGLTYSKRTYRDRDGKPVIAYVLEADLTRVDVLNATPGYGNVISHVKATTAQAMKSAEQAGFQVWGGVNADFFRINGDYSPQGLCIKQGRVLSGTGGRPWFGITKDGVPVMGTDADYSKYAGKLQEAVGGSAILLRDGFVVNVDYLSAAKADRHPRTVVGVREDGTLLLIAVDGRQTKLSNGASLSDLAGILLELGAVDGINLDGGGSTTLITTNGEGKYTVRNSPSDGSLRSVYNSLIVVSKKS